jgi:hypothetical protein
MSATRHGLDPLYAYARELEPSETEIQQAIDRFARATTRSRRRLRAIAVCTAAALLVGTVSAIADVGPLGQITRSRTVSAYERIDQLNAAIENCMLAHGATLTVTGSERALTDPGHRGADACAVPINAEAAYVRGPDYQAAETDQKARIPAYVTCMEAAGYPVPGWNGLSNDTPSPPPTAASTASSETCSDGAGLVRRNPGGSGFAPASAPLSR